MDLKAQLVQSLASLLQGHSSQSLEQKLKSTEEPREFAQVVVTSLAQEKVKSTLTVNHCTRLVHFLKRQGEIQVITGLVSSYSQADFSFSLKLKLISDLMNIMNDNKAIKTLAINRIFDLSIENKAYGHLYVALQNAKSILADLEVQDRRSIYAKLYKCQKSENQKLSLDFAIEFLQQFEDNDNATLETEKSLILEAVKTVITSEQYSYNFGSLLEFQSIQFLSRGEQQLQALLKIFVESDLQKYLSWKNGNQAYLDLLQIDQEKFLARLRVSCFVHLADQHKSVSFKEVAAYLQVQGDEVEDWVITAFENKTVQGKIDQLQELVEFQGNQGNLFDKHDWERLNKQLMDVQNNLAHNLETIQAKQ